MLFKFKQIELNQLYRYALALTNHENTAYDLVHDAMIKLSKKIFLNKMAYAKKTIRNLHYDELRKRKVMKTFASYHDEEISNDEDIIIAKDQIINLLKDLNDYEREVIYLHYVEGHSYKEISQLTDVPSGSLRTLVHRLKAKLSQEYQNE